MKKSPPTIAEVGVAFRRSYEKDPGRAVKLAEAFAAGLPDLEIHQSFFQHLAASPVEERRAGIQGYRDAGQGSAVVHAVGFLPAAQGRVIMKKFLIKPDGARVHLAFCDAARWFQRAGEALRRAKNPSPCRRRGRIPRWLDGSREPSTPSWGP